MACAAESARRSVWSIPNEIDCSQYTGGFYSKYLTFVRTIWSQKLTHLLYSTFGCFISYFLSTPTRFRKYLYLSFDFVICSNYRQYNLSSFKGLLSLASLSKWTLFKRIITYCGHCGCPKRSAPTRTLIQSWGVAYGTWVFNRFKVTCAQLLLYNKYRLQSTASSDVARGATPALDDVFHFCGFCK